MQSIAQNQPFGSADAPQAQPSQSVNVVEQTRQRLPSKPDFNSFYDEHIKPSVEKVADPIEKQESRSNTLFLVLVSTVILGGLGVGLFGPNKFSGTGASLPTINQLTGMLSSLLPLVVIGGVSLFVWAYFFRKTNQPTKSNVKLNSSIVPELFNYLNNGCTYNKTPTLTGDDQDFLGMGSRKVKYTCRDEVVGVYKGTAFKMMALETDKKGSGSNALQDTDETVFKSVYLLLDVPKSFSGRVDINRNCDASPNADSDAVSNMKRVQLEDPTFDRAFRVFADDQIEARYLLTTSMMQSLERLRSRIGGPDLEGSFYNGKLALRIDCPENLFDVKPGLYAEAYRGEALRMTEDLNKILDTIESMDLRTRGVV